MTVPRLFDVTKLEEEEERQRKYEEDEEQRRRFGEHATVSGVQAPPPPAKIVVDGANLAWGYGQVSKTKIGTLVEGVRFQGPEWVDVIN